ncbi:hypothetical protein C5C66_07820 [Rathayibacter toxicus]|uniref:Glycosyltransferase n=1 Tax=Rathayibacter toxicus TaxID=145458 RepID=A0A0C5BHZ1_9MICO|nr:glycosyltransferase family 4 protein [Rathayibacter toxicus]AJM77905.1 hypothetical protein TI83_07980 [Rathayibacter toxicus]ALS57901.1 hypothetical protein APU90_09105 [Rathayibacter toxicus]KKM46905.1 hypothetical protein VT73_01110 [Rathayibacter toxicus]PPG20421.1 hypothetical protein C5D15_07820 [Rathayibacter toxicus]PPG45523.1 hypothetical protein C5D16_07790 [Rathayibacter toxicus]
MRILFLADDVLFPTDNGGRVELLGEVRSLLAAGHSVQLVVFHRRAMTPQDRERHRELVPKTIFVARWGFISASIRSPLMPYQLSSRRPTSSVSPTRLGRPEVIVASHEWTMKAAQRWSRVTGAPILLRSHNNERAFLSSLARHASGGHAAYLWAEGARLGLSVRRGLLRPVAAVGVISAEDAQAYRSFSGPVVPLPPVFPEVGPTLVRSVPPVDERIAFVGALDQSHTEKGLRWFVESVLPLIREQRPSTCFVVAGRRSSADLAAFLRRAEGVDFIGEVDDVSQLYLARVFVNPIFSGSGVNMKMGAPAVAGQPTVSTSYGVRGLGALAEAVTIADTPLDFARACRELLADDALWQEHSQRVRRAAEANAPERIAELWTQLLERVSEMNSLTRFVREDLAPASR